MDTVTRVWSLYEKGVRLHQKIGLVGNTEKAHRFYEGDQWYGLESGEPLPVYNFIAPVINYKVASIASAQMAIYFSDVRAAEPSSDWLSLLNQKAAMWWEKKKMDALCWKMLKESAIAGESYLYFYNGEGDCQMVDNTNVFLGDEQCADIQRQPYILLYERRAVDQVKALAEQNGLPPEKVALITEDGEDYLGESDGKCSVLLYMSVREGDLYFSRSTRYVEVEPERLVPGMDRYPLAALVTNSKKGSARGRGEVLPLIANQIEVNRNLVRRIVNAKMTAFSRLVYATDKIDNPEDLNRVGTAIAVSDSTVSDIHSAVGYVTPSPMSGDAKSIADELLSVTKELAGAGGSALGTIDPTQTSGAAIIAVRDQAKIPLNELAASFRQFVEDVALIWYRLWQCYHIREFEALGVSAREMQLAETAVRIDATDKEPFSKYAREQSLQGFFEKGAITFEEFVRALDDDASIPKSRLLEIIQQRKEHEVYE